MKTFLSIFIHFLFIISIPNLILYFNACGLSKINSHRVQIIIRSFLFKFLFLSSKKKNIFLNHESKKKKKKWCFICINHEWMKFSLFSSFDTIKFYRCMRPRAFIFCGYQSFQKEQIKLSLRFFCVFEHELKE